ncbi:MAG TPA: ATP-binding protein [Myxococcales bacterium LLY-WYZ-16_1]|nr:ATP-binding protein [Myxococcales bacterium LLY-WYZ-16_1]
MRPAPSRFELRIIFAIVLSAVAPLVASLIFIPQLIQARFAELSHEEVKAQLDRHAAFYRDFFEAKKREYAASARAIATDPELIEAGRAGRSEAAVDRLKALILDDPGLHVVRLRRADGTLWVEHGELPSEELRSKTLLLALHQLEPLQLELVFGLDRTYFEQQKRAEEVALLYDASLRTFGQRFAEKQQTYYAILAVVALLALGLGFFIARAVTRRVAALAEATERVARGELEFQLPVSGDDEIAELSRRFNRMLNELENAQRRIIDLEKISGWQDFARRLAHEIKNPLTPIRLAVHELKRRVPERDPTFRKLVVDAAEVVEDETHRLTRLVNEFSQFARLPDVQPRRTDLVEFLQDFLRAYTGLEKQVELHVPATPVMVQVDPDQMRQVLHNLVINGLEACPDRDSARVSVRLEVASGGARIHVDDHGPGLPTAGLDKLFEPYFTTKSQGTGLGLAIAKKIILQHGGTIRAADRPGEGATFSILLPFDGPVSASSGRRLAPRQLDG